MLRWQIGVCLLAAGLVIAASAGDPAQARIIGHVAPDLNVNTRIPKWEACGAPPERMVPMTAAMLGKPVTLATAPLDALVAELKLDAGQKKRINAIQDKLEKDARGPAKAPRGSDPTDRLARMTDLLTQADKDIDAELTAEQKPASVELLKKLSTLRAAGVPPDLYVALKLTPEQLKSLEEALPDIKQENKERSNAMLAAARSHNMNKVRSLQESLGEKVSAILTKDQKSLVEKYLKKHPMTGTTMFDFSSMGLGDGGLPGPSP